MASKCNNLQNVSLLKSISGERNFCFYLRKEFFKTPNKGIFSLTCHIKIDCSYSVIYSNCFLYFLVFLTE